MSILSEEINLSLVKTIAKALERQHQIKWWPTITKDDVIKPLIEMAEYVYTAREAGLDRRSECSYAGSLLVTATLETKNVKYASNVEVVNQIYLAGMKLAGDIWDKLDVCRFHNFEEMIQRMANLLWDEYQRMSYSIAEQVEKK